jgi:uncharacterized membrane protein YfcA
MTLPQALLLFVAAVLAGALNSVAGGGTFITVPTLIFTGVAAKAANITNTIALFPGSLASVGAYRKELAEQRRELLFLGGISLVGGVVGAELLLGTPQQTFLRLLPYLLLLATLVFIFGPRITAWLRTRRTASDDAPEGVAAFGGRPSWRALLGVGLAQLVISIYGGFFGGGIGILMLAGLGLMGMRNIHKMNALKTVLASVINGVAAVTFIVRHAAIGDQVFVLTAGAILGGYVGAAYARRLDPRIVRGFVIVVAVTITAIFLVFRRDG